MLFGFVTQTAGGCPKSLHDIRLVEAAPRRLYDPISSRGMA